MTSENPYRSPNAASKSPSRLIQPPAWITIRDYGAGFLGGGYLGWMISIAVVQYGNEIELTSWFLLDQRVVFAVWLLCSLAGGLIGISSVAFASASRRKQ